MHTRSVTFGNIQNSTCHLSQTVVPHAWSLRHVHLATMLFAVHRVVVWDFVQCHNCSVVA